MDFNVVVVDDAPVNVKLMSYLTERLEDCTAIGFTSAPEALAWCEKSEPDLLLVDFMMPELDGIEFLRRFRALPARAEVPFLMITANGDVSVRHAALQQGANDFLTKPIDRTEFMARARNMLSMRRSQRALADRADWLAGEVRRATADILSRERETVLRLSRAAESRDPETGAHVHRMAHLSRLIAANLALPQDEQDLVLEAAPMHDIGKVGIPDHILLKPGKLDEAEFAIMKRHTVIGHEILAGSSSTMLQAAAQIALGHHERFDGGGYPHGVSGTDIPLLARICAVADVFDALTSVRPYKPAWDEERAVAYLREAAGRQFDPDCVAAFVADWPAVRAIRQRYCEPPAEPALPAAPPSDASAGT
jgi:putative two-component system response regulator